MDTILSLWALQRQSGRQIWLMDSSLHTSDLGDENFKLNTPKIDFWVSHIPIQTKKLTQIHTSQIHISRNAIYLVTHAKNFYNFCLFYILHPVLSAEPLRYIQNHSTFNHLNFCHTRQTTIRSHLVYYISRKYLLPVTLNSIYSPHNSERSFQRIRLYFTLLLKRLLQLPISQRRKSLVHALA